MTFGRVFGAMLILTGVIALAVILATPGDQLAIAFAAGGCLSIGYGLCRK